MARFIEFMTDQGVSLARAELLESEAPRTCALIWDMLPVTVTVQHAIYSGAELAMILPRYVDFGPENATTVFLPWELGFVSLKASDYIDVEADFSEIMFFYDRNTGPKMLDGLVKCNLFGRFVSGQEALTRLAKQIRQEGRKTLEIRRVEGGA